MSEEWGGAQNDTQRRVRGGCGYVIMCTCVCACVEKTESLTLAQ